MWPWWPPQAQSLSLSYLSLPFPNLGVTEDITEDTLDIAKALGLPVSSFPMWQA